MRATKRERELKREKRKNKKALESNMENREREKGVGKEWEP